MKKIAPLAIVAIMLAAAPTQASGTKEVFGTMIGGALGGYAGSNIGKGTGRLAATAGGAVLGAVIGNSAGASMDRTDRMYYSRPAPGYGHYGSPQVVYVTPPPPTVIYRPAPVYVERYVEVPVYREPRQRWRDHDYGRVGYVAPQPQQHCREYQTNVSVGGLPQPGYGIACLQPDGSWKIVR